MEGQLPGEASLHQNLTGGIRLVEGAANLLKHDRDSPNLPRLRRVGNPEPGYEIRLNHLDELKL
jgi:hypothetical protein